MPRGDSAALNQESGCWKTKSSNSTVSCHTSRKTQSWQSENFFKYIFPKIWTPNSLDCNPFDYYVRGVIEKETNKTMCNAKKELKVTIKAAFTNSNENFRWQFTYRTLYPQYCKPVMIFLPFRDQIKFDLTARYPIGHNVHRIYQRIILIPRQNSFLEESFRLQRKLNQQQINFFKKSCNQKAQKGRC